MAKARGIAGLLDVHAEIDHVAEDLHVACAFMSPPFRPKLS